MAYLSGTAGSEVTLVGSNIYPLPDTAIYFNTVSTANRAQIVADSFSPNYTSVNVLVPDGLPEISRIIFYNGVSYTTGRGQFRFIGKPKITSIFPTAGYWRDQITISGSDFVEVSSVKLAGLEADFTASGFNTISFLVPSEGKNGQISVESRGGSAIFTTGAQEPFIFQAFEAPITIDGFFPTSGKFTDKIFVSGLSFHKANEVRVSGIDGEIVLTDFDLIDTTGISFSIPQDSVTENKIKILKTVDSTVGGYYLPSIVEEAVSNSNLKINNKKIISFSPTTGVYGEEISVSGLNLSGAAIFFRSYSTGAFPKYYIEPLEVSYIDSTGVLIKVPREIVKDHLYVSGNLFNCILSVTGSGEVDSQGSFSEYFLQGGCGRSINDLSLGHYDSDFSIYNSYTYVGLIGNLAVTGFSSGASISSYDLHFSSGYTGSYLSGYGVLTSGIYLTGLATSSGLLTYEITGTTGDYPFIVSGWVTSGTIITNYYTTSGDIYDVVISPSPQRFTPLPTVSGVTDMKVNQPFTLTGVNCSEIYNLLFISGENRLKSNLQEISVVSNEDYQFLSKEGSEIDYLEYFRYIGRMGFDLSEVTGNLPDSAKTGNFLITGIVNDTFIGTGQVFLISEHDSISRSYDFNYFSDIQSFTGDLSGFYTTNNLSKVLSQSSINISGEPNEIGDITIDASAPGILITGKYLQDVTGIFLTGLAGNLSTGILTHITQLSNSYVENYFYVKIEADSSVFRAAKDFYNRGYSLNLYEVKTDYSQLLSDPSNTNITGNTFYEDYSKYYSGQILLNTPYYE